ncbi:MAG: hypothetical protein EOO93_02885 [Pedobacter sp.]|nr:MAG: hypothetical protein EOO93_02885 [Pedobacter sp.]
MKTRLIIHYIIGICALLLSVAAAYFIQQNPDNLFSAGIIAFGGLMVAVSQYLIIKRGNKSS